eukprot:g29416.t1
MDTRGVAVSLLLGLAASEPTGVAPAQWPLGTATAAESNTSWPQGFQPPRLGDWPMDPDGRPISCWDVTTLHDHAKGWPGLSFGAYVVRWAPWRPGSALNRSGPLHLDARLHPERRRSVVLPLTGKGREEDGGTVFPCVETEDMDVQELRRREKLCSRAMRHLQLAHDKLMAVRDEGLALAPSEQYAFLEKHPELAGLPKEPTGGWLSGMKKGLSFLKAPGLRVLSRRGDALVMDVMETETPREVKPDWRLWHAGCSPEEPEEERLTAQIFLYSPSNSTCNVESCRKAVIH